MKTCIFCKKSYNNRKKRSYCSLDCYNKHRKIKKKIIKKICPICEKEFIARKAKQITCSKSCGNTYFRQNENNPSYIDGNTTYRKKCFEFHDHKCIICEEKHILEAHHIDRNKKNNVPENLVPLCPTHHRYCHSKFRKSIENKIDKYLQRYFKDVL